jgi:glycosyltransferase involved in cell wall biosynthesis
MRILMLCDWLPPEYSAVGQYTALFARELAGAGHDVTLVGLSSAAAGVEAHALGSGHLLVRRVRRPGEDGGGLAKRVRWMIAANTALLWASRRELRRADEVRFTGSPAYMLHFVMPVAKALGVRSRYRITDFHPEWLAASLGRTPWWLVPVFAATRFWRRRVDVVEALGEDQRERLLESRVDPSRIELRRDPSPVDVSPATRPVARPPRLAGRKVILYSGHWGAPHDHETFVEGFARHCAAHPGGAGLWINAVGPRADLVEQACERRGLPCARTRLVPLDALPGVLAAADLHLVALADAFVGYALPSKVYACIASGKPILFVGSAASDVHRVCVERVPAANYRRAAVGDADGVARALAELLGNDAGAESSRIRAMGDAK